MITCSTRAADAKHPRYFHLSTQTSQSARQNVSAKARSQGHRVTGSQQTPRNQWVIHRHSDAIGFAEDQQAYSLLGIWVYFFPISQFPKILRRNVHHTSKALALSSSPEWSFQRRHPQDKAESWEASIPANPQLPRDFHLISLVYLSSKQVMTQKGSLVFCSFRSAQSYWSSRQLGQLLLHIPTVVHLICWLITDDWYIYIYIFLIYIYMYVYVYNCIYIYIHIYIYIEVQHGPSQGGKKASLILCQRYAALVIASKAFESEEGGRRSYGKIKAVRGTSDS